MKILRWTAIIVTVATLMSLLAVFMLARWPYFSDIVKCQANIRELYDAAQRYRATHDDQYPATLDELSKEYLKDPSVLYCPLAKEHKGKSSYIYNPPTEGEENPEPLILCDKHRMGPEFDVTQVYITVDGSPGMRPDPNSVRKFKLDKNNPKLIIPKTMEPNKEKP